MVERAVIGSKGGRKLNTIILSCKVFHDWSIIKLWKYIVFIRHVYLLTSIKDITLLQICEKMMCSNPNLDLVNINAYTNFGKILSICAQDIEQKLNYDRWNDRRND